jgi:YD repeat-containing protein
MPTRYFRRTFLSAVMCALTLASVVHAQDGSTKPILPINGPPPPTPENTTQDPGTTVTAKDPGFGGYSTGGAVETYNGIKVTNLEGVSVSANRAPAAKTGENPNGNKDVAGEPVQLSSGTKIDTEVDFALPGEMGLTYVRYYNSTAGYPFGRQWTDNLDYLLDDTCDGATSDSGRPICHQITIYHPDGSTLIFSGMPATTTAQYVELGGGLASLIYNADGTYTLHDEDSTTQVYTGGIYGQIQSLKDVSGVGWTFAYSAPPATMPTSGTTTYSSTVTVTHTNGQVMTRTGTETYTVGGVSGHSFSGTTTVNDSAGHVYTYTGAAGGGIDTVTFPGVNPTVISYKYLPNTGLLTEVDYNGVPHDYTTYDTSQSLYNETGPVSSTYFADGSQTTTMSYVMAANGAGPASATVTNALGHTTVNTYGAGSTIVGGINQLLSVSDTAVADGPATTYTRAYDGNGHLTQTVDNNGNTHTYTYAANGQLQTETEASGTAIARTTDYVWDPNATLNRLLSVTVEGWSKTVYTYYEGNRLATVAVTNLTGTGTANQTLTTTYTYVLYPSGLVQTKTVAHPSPNNTDTDTYNYDALGNLTSSADGLGHTTTYTSYNLLGEPGAVTGPNGDETDYTYDARGRVTTKTTHPYGIAGTWMYSYDGFGLLSSVTTPDGDVTTTTRNAESQITSIVRNDKDGASTEHFSRDALGDITWHTVARGGTIAQAESASYDALGRVYDGLGTNSQVVAYTYDGNGNTLTATDALGDETLSQYDALDRVSQTTRTTGAVPVIVPPPPPEAGVPVITLPASDTTGTYTVSWTAVNTATSYTLQEQQNGGVWTTVQATAATSFAVSGKANGNYGYRVQACTSGGCAPFSAVSTINEDVGGAAPSPIPALDGFAYTSGYEIPNLKTGYAEIGVDIAGGTTWEVFTQTPAAAAPVVVLSGAVPTGAVTVQYTWTLVGPPSGDVGAGGAVTNPATSPMAISGNPSSNYATGTFGDQSGSRGDTYQVTVDFFDAAGNHISHSVCTLTAETDGSV